MSKSLLFRKITVSLVGFFLVAILWVQVFGWHRPYFNWSPKKLAAYLVENNRPPKECLDLLYFQIMAPSQAEQRALCIHEYANLAEDPSACESLMPSTYGLSCVGTAAKFLPCLFDDKKNVIWNDGEYHEVPFEECENVQGSPMGLACCQAAASKFDPEFRDGCFAFVDFDPLLADHCQYQVAQKLLDRNLCNDIQDMNVRTACNMEVGALRDNPDLRSNYPFINPH